NLPGCVNRQATADAAEVAEVGHDATAVQECIVVARRRKISKPGDLPGVVDRLGNGGNATGAESAQRAEVSCGVGKAACRRGNRTKQKGGKLPTKGPVSHLPVLNPQIARLPGGKMKKRSQVYRY